MLRLLRLTLIASLAVAAIGGAGFGLFSTENLLMLLRSHARLSVAIYLALHVAASLLMVPRSLLGIVAGAVFGLGLGTGLSLVGASLGGLVGFLLARFLNAGAIKPETLPRIGPWLARAETHGLRIAIIARLLPGLPHTAVNYALGLSRMKVMDYVLGSALGMVPTAFVFANIGASGLEALGGSMSGTLITLGWAVLLIGLSVFSGWFAQRFS